ncbi:hypothetical protein BDW74DRAFT_100985 [Aspergillus multicolor]|uniref:uncharacterized protein n=1 Tax=Aspergillus multicolor TaxID=41759 RepID=UPI003CCE312D
MPLVLVYCILPKRIAAEAMKTSYTYQKKPVIAWQRWAISKLSKEMLRWRWVCFGGSADFQLAQMHHTGVEACNSPHKPQNAYPICRFGSANNGNVGIWSLFVCTSSINRVRLCHSKY